MAAPEAPWPNRRAGRGYDEGQGREGFGRRLFLLRFRRLGLSQETFADRFGLSLGSIKDLEQSRSQPTKAMRVLIAAIELDPILVAKAAYAANLAGTGTP